MKGKGDYSILCIILGVIVRWGIAYFPYSGEGKSPKFGDFEAQRHWMEITVNLPLRKWYVNSTENDLNYWGLDYPPLSAYHSLGIGQIFKRILPESMEYQKSQGHESPMLKFLMRLSVLFGDLLIPALTIFHHKFLTTNSESKKVHQFYLTLMALTAPPLIIIDYGHFQYNCVSLGLTVLATIFLFMDKISISGILFTLAVNHKQMSLYHAFPFLSHMIALVVFRKKDFILTLRVGFFISLTLATLWLPFGSIEGIKSVFERIFPLKRGVFEDKVGTFWYFLDRVTTIRGIIPDSNLAKICALMCFILILPSAIHLFKTTIFKESEIRNKTFLLSLFNISMIFFLFSYHVHEKSIMLPCLASVLLLNHYTFEMIWFILVSSLSLYPLLYEEKSHIALLINIGIFIIIALQANILQYNKSYILRFLLLCSMAGYGSLIVAIHFLTPPNRLPHLFQAGFALFSFLHYTIFVIYFHFVQLFTVSHMKTTKSETKIKSN